MSEYIGGKASLELGEKEPFSQLVLRRMQPLHHIPMSVRRGSTRSGSMLVGAAQHIWRRSGRGPRGRLLGLRIEAHRCHRWR